MDGSRVAMVGLSLVCVTPVARAEDDGEPARLSEPRARNELDDEWAKAMAAAPPVTQPLTPAAREQKPTPGARPPLTVAEANARCAEGHREACFLVGKTFLTGSFMELEDARINYDAAAMARTGLRGGWSYGLRLGMEFKDWVPLHWGLRHAAPNDTRSFTQFVPRQCSPDARGFTTCSAPGDKTSTVGGLLTSLETGLEPNFQVARGAALSPGLLIGYVGAIAKYRRSIDWCSDCRVEPIDLQLNAGYVAASLRFTWSPFGIALRYERFFGGEQTDAIAIAVDFGMRYKAIPSDLLRGQ
jgi:hypothetical protein